MPARAAGTQLKITEGVRQRNFSINIIIFTRKLTMLDIYHIIYRESQFTEVLAETELVVVESRLTLPISIHPKDLSTF